MISAVIDTQILLRAVTKQTTLAGKIIRGYLPLYQFVYSQETRAEIFDVIQRPKLRRKFPNLKDEAVAVLDSVFVAGVRVTLSQPISTISRDPKDDIFLATALAGGADYLVTQDDDLLALKQHANIKIVDLPTFWDVLQAAGET